MPWDGISTLGTPLFSVRPGSLGLGPAHAHHYALLVGDFHGLFGHGDGLSSLSIDRRGHAKGQTSSEACRKKLTHHNSSNQASHPLGGTNRPHLRRCEIISKF
jgi:hypothetical protein